MYYYIIAQLTGMMPFPPAYWMDKINQSKKDIMLECFSPPFPKFVNRNGKKKPFFLGIAGNENSRSSLKWGSREERKLAQTNELTNERVQRGKYKRRGLRGPKNWFLVLSGLSQNVAETSLSWPINIVSYGVSKCIWIFFLKTFSHWKIYRNEFMK